MASLYAGVIHFFQTDSQQVILDNLRLLKAGIDDGATLSILQDNSSFPQIQELPMTPPVWNPYAGAKDKSPLVLEEPVLIDMSYKGTSYGLLNSNYAITAVDNNRLMISADISAYGPVIQSLDGGKTWGQAVSTYHSMNAPENFFPVAWSHTQVMDAGGNKWIKFLRIPIDNPTRMEKKGMKAPLLFSLKNSPNPFTSFTVFSYYLPSKGDISLRIYDRSGRLVQSLMQKRQAAGQRTIKWNANRLAAGVYFARINAAGFSSSRKILILR